MRLDVEDQGYEMWEEVRLGPIPHSRLCDLEPIGVGTPMVECLTSYITRLADAHSVSPVTLVTHEILPQFLQEGRSVHAQLSSVFRASASLNGVAAGTENWVWALEQLTGRRDLRFLTLLTFSKVLSPRSLLRRTRAWCPFCYQGWREAHLVVYEPLLWKLECVSVCVHHHLPLSCCCPYPDCSAVLLPLEPRMVPGYCPKCHRWMGYSKPLTQSEDARSDEEWQLWVVQTVGELLATGPELAVSPCRERIAARLTRLLDTLLDGKKTELARQLNRNGSCITDWLTGKQIPHMGNLLRICFLFQTTLPGFFAEKAPLEILPPRTVPQKSVPGGRTRRRPRRFDTNGIKRALEDAMLRDPPPPMRQVAKQLGYDPSNVSKHFPDLCQAISQRYRVSLAKNMHIRLQRECDELREAMQKLTAQGIYPSQRQLQKVLSKPGMLLDPRIRAAWYEVLQELGWKS